LTSPPDEIYTAAMNLKILVCVRAVPDLESFPAAEAPRFPAIDGLRYRLNDFDLFALEEAARWREGIGARVTVVTAGPARAEEQLRKAVALAGDEGYRLDLSEADDADPLRTAAALADFARPRGFGLILCGAMSEDRMRQAVGPMVAELLGLPSVSQVVRLELANNQATVERELEAGARERLALPLPCLLAVQTGINVPRYASLSDVLRVKKMELPVLPVNVLEAPARLGSEWRVPERGRCELVVGSAEEVAAVIAERIRKTAPVL